MNIQRFKGLGEMNPEELWNTTLDPSSRNLLKVQYSKDIKKDQGLIHKLMGNEVMKGLPGGFDIWQIVAGGPPGASHIVVFANNSFAESMNFNRESAADPSFARDFAALGKFRTILGSSWTTSPVKYGSSELNSIR